MLTFLTKKDLWDAIDDGFVPKKPIVYHLKYAQDVIAYSLIGKHGGRVIGEIGADHSRLLPDLQHHGNKCFAIDTYDRAIGGGKTSRPVDANYRFFDCLVGSSSRNVIPDSFFDLTFSVSVLEHVPDLPNFFSENIRITKPGGIILHMIDIYLCDSGITFQPAIAEHCINFINQSDISPLSDQILKFNDFSFSTTFATNGDDMMYKWNNQVPSLKMHREQSAVCCLMLGARRK